MPRITKAAGEEKYYAIRMYNPASPKRTLQARDECIFSMFFPLVATVDRITQDFV